MTSAADPQPLHVPIWRDPMHRAVHALGLTQITAWGTSFYSLGILAAPISKDLGWSKGAVYLGFTVALLVMGTVSSTIGRLIDRRGGRLVMTIGTVLLSIGLFALSRVHDETMWLVAWGFLGLAMRMTLYDAAFAAIVQVAPSRGRKAISYLTLYGAFASSVFWVVGHFIEEAVGWRQTLAIFAAINLAVCLPLNWWGLSRREAAPAAGPATATAAATSDDPPLEGAARRLGIALFALIMSLNGFVFGVVSLQLVPLLEAAGLATATAVWIASLKGVAQFGGRVVEIVFGRNLKAITVARIAIAVLPASLVLLMLAGGRFGPILAFTLLMGGAQGVITIVRGAVPLALFGAEGYGAVLGAIATPVLLVNALSPTIYAFLVDLWGSERSLFVMLACALAAMLAMEVMAFWYRRRRRPA